MQTALRATTRVLAGGKVELIVPQLPMNELVEVIILFSMPNDYFTRRSAWDILAEVPGHRLFKTAADVDKYLTEERNAWDN